MNSQFEEFCTLITEINSEITAIKIRETEDLGLKGSHVMLLYELERHPEGLTAAQLSEMLSLDKAAISRAVAQLSQKGLVDTGKMPDGKRRYRSEITLTPSGTAAAKRLDEKIDKAVKAGAVGDFSEEERKSFYASLRHISMQLGKYRRDLYPVKKSPRCR